MLNDRRGSGGLSSGHLDLSILSRVPDPAERRIALRVTPESERELRRGYPWLFEAAITRQSHEGSPGDLAVIFDRKRRFLAVGLYDPHSSIRVRVLQHGTQAAIGRDWFAASLAAASRLRSPLRERNGKAATTGYRLVHGENDGLPGLVVDRYEGTAVLKLYTAAWLPHLRDVLPALAEVLPAERLVLRLGRAMMDHPDTNCGLVDGMVLHGPALDGTVLFSENGLRFEADPVRGHKTGFYFDQRDNRARVEQLASNKTVLNTFAYTGAFSVSAARGGARQVVSVDVSAPALQAATRNLERNRGFPGIAAAAHETIRGDVFEVLARMGGQARRFDMVIVDPPAFARRVSHVDQALASYQRLTRLSLAVLEPGGVLVQASCSSRVAPEAFFDAVKDAAARARRPLLEIERTAHALDHPITFRDGAYLKCLFAHAP
jgi:23S rRNA (cytosine1962-C5)-methyltransferase